MDIDLNSLLGDSSSSSGLFDPTTLLAPLMPFIILITVASILIGVLYFLNMITTYRSHKATIEMRDIMREMNERDKARSPKLNSVSSYDAVEPTNAAESAAS